MAYLRRFCGLALTRPLLVLGALSVLSGCGQHEEIPGLKKNINKIIQHTAGPEDFRGVPPQGIGGDPDLNLKKNRTVAPAKIETYSVQQIATIPSEKLRGTDDDTRKYWSAEAKAYADKWENKGVMVEGYLVKAKLSGKESANGNSDSLRDIHLWIVQDRKVNKREGIIAEVTPRWQMKNPRWNIDDLAKLAEKRAHIRITGWLLWDEDHPDEVGKSRGSQWEIHPLTKIELEQSGNWEEFSH